MKTSATISFHGDDYARAKPAINVKTHHLVHRIHNVEVPNGVNGETAWGIMQERWWILASQIAHIHGYAGVFAEGRSGGWLVPFDASKDGKKGIVLWNGSLGNMTPVYPDVKGKIRERIRFMEFQKDIEAHLAHVPVMYQEQVDAMAEEEGLKVYPTDTITGRTLKLYRDLADKLSDMVEEGRLNTTNIPEDYAELVETLASIAGADPKKA